MQLSKIWFVTGASKGPGLLLVRQLLAQSYTVATTSRHSNELAQAVQPAAADRFLPLQVDLGEGAYSAADNQMAVVQYQMQQWP